MSVPYTTHYHVASAGLSRVSTSFLLVRLLYTCIPVSYPQGGVQCPAAEAHEPAVRAFAVSPGSSLQLCRAKPCIFPPAASHPARKPSRCDPCSAVQCGL
ncbi:hypothetical protein GDO81_005418 [Engystomops pustulosus]|uniref:Secreted protein n=1 Tax=Engystomops pustulosus TaxID=76066 RepID=A0AAV7CN78_ENGPU|nr:hypothetical protein GDO81_005418 [Engystomops pustulosus]